MRSPILQVLVTVIPLVGAARAPSCFMCQRVRIQICVHPVLPVVKQHEFFFVANLSRSFVRGSALSLGPANYSSPSWSSLPQDTYITSRYIHINTLYVVSSLDRNFLDASSPDQKSHRLPHHLLAIAVVFRESQATKTVDQ
jgi:hypothetical protein